MTSFDAPPGVPRIVLTREFDAPPAALFRAHTEPDLLAGWIGPAALGTTVDVLEPKHGGRWRFTHRDPHGGVYSFHGLYHGTPTPESIVQTWEFDQEPGVVYLNTITFEDLGGRTRLVQTTVYQDVAHRDAYLKAGARPGVERNHERLAAIVAGLDT